MKSVLKFCVAMSVAAIGESALISSCVNPEYELSEDNINTDITIAQDGLVLPLGKTAPITLGELYDKYGQDLKDYIQNEDGKYGFRYAGSFDFSKEVTDVKEKLAIDALSINENFSFDLSNVSLDGLKIKATQIPQQEVNISQMLQMSDLDSSLPKLNKSFQGASIELPNLDADDITVDFAEFIEDFEYTTPIISLNTDLNVPDIVKDMPEYYKAEMLYSLIKDNATLQQYGVYLPDIADTYSFDEYSVKVPVRIVLPKEVQSVEDIKLHEDARFELILQMLNPFFTVGAFTPHLLINLHDLFHVDKIMSGMEDMGYMDHDGINHHIHDNFVMSAENGWKADHIYHIEKLAYNEWKKDEATGQLVLDKEIEITVSGKLELETDELRTTLELLDTKGREPMSLKVNLNFFDFVVDDVVMKIAPISMSEELEMPFNVSGIQLPDMVKKIEYVEFDKNSPLNINMSATVPEACKDMDINLKTLKIEFPEGVEVEHDKYDPSSRTLVYSDVLLSKGLNDDIKISKLCFGDLVDGTLNYSGAVKVTAQAEASGIISAKDLLDPSKTGNVDMNVNISYAPQLEDYSLVIDDYRHKVEIDPIRISEELPAQVGEMEKVLVYLENDPVIKVNFDYPATIESLRILSDKEEGLKVYFPQMLKFRSLPSSYNHDAATNSITFTKGQALPKVIELPIDRLEIVPEKDGDKYYVRGEIKVEGGICLEGTTIDKSVVDALVAENASISFSAEVPELVPARLSVDQYVASINEAISLDMMKIEGVPEMIKSIDQINFKDVYLDLEMDASSVAELIDNVDADLDFDVTLPKLIIVEGAQSGNVLSLSGKLNEENKVVINPVKIVGLDLSEVEIKDETMCLDGLNIAIDGNISLKNISVDIQDLKADELSIAVNGSIATRGTDKIDLEKVEATVDYQLEPISQTLSLAGLMGDIEGVDYSLDLNRYHLALDLKTNLALPLKANVDVLPYYGDKVDESKKRTLPLSVNWSLPANDTTHTRLWISNSENDKPLDNDYTHAVLDLLSIVNDMPDSIRFDISASTEPNAKFVIEPAADYVLKADYEFGLPLEFGDDFHVSFSQVIEELPDVINEVLATGSIGLGGKVINNLPLQLDLELQLLDDEGNIIPLADGTGHQTIRSCALDGTPQETELQFILSLANSAKQTEVAAIRLQFTVSSRGASGVQLHDDCFIQAELALLIPEGISMNIKDLMNPEDNNK